MVRKTKVKLKIIYIFIYLRSCYQLILKLLDNHLLKVIIYPCLFASLHKLPINIEEILHASEKLVIA